MLYSSPSTISQRQLPQSLNMDDIESNLREIESCTRIAQNRMRMFIDMAQCHNTMLCSCYFRRAVQLRDDIRGLNKEYRELMPLLAAECIALHHRLNDDTLRLIVAYATSS
jgi:hypothetical protein